MTLTFILGISNNSSSFLLLPFLSLPKFLIFWMKGDISGYKGKQLFLLLLIVIAGTTFLIWRWDTTPFFSALAPRDVNLQFSQETPLENVSKEDVTKVGNYGSPEAEVNGESNEALTNPTMDPISSDSLEEKDNQTVGENDLKQIVPNSDLLIPAAKNASLTPPVDKKNHTVLVNDQTCNYAKGKWVIDDHGPLYSGFECKQWLSQMWACRLMQRTDFSYEKLRWQPIDCPMDAFEGAKFLQRMQDKTLAFVGDSLGRQQFQSLMCMVTGGKETTDVLDVGLEYGLVKPKGASRPNGWAYRFLSTNTTILYYWSSCLCDLDPIDLKNPTTNYAMHLDRPPQFLHRFLHKIHVLVLNTGHHWNRGKIQANRWVMYVGGKPNTNKYLARIGDAKNFTIHNVIKWVNEQLPKNPHLKAFYRTISPRHFVNGEWNTGGSCDNTIPMSVGKEISGDESSDYSAWNAVKGTGVRLLDITGLSGVRDEGHISRFSVSASRGVHDCLHWCLPGVPDTWNDILFAHITYMSH